MARELLLVRWCDGDHEGDVEATTVRRLSIDEGESILLDLCDVCDKVVQDMIVFLERGVPAAQAIMPPGAPPTKRPRGGVKPVKPSADPHRRPSRRDGKDRRDCPECDYVGATRSALGQHLKAKHATKFSDYDWTPAT